MLFKIFFNLPILDLFLPFKITIYVLPFLFLPATTIKIWLIDCVHLQGMLEPTKEPMKPISAAEKIASIGQTSAVSPEINICTSDQLQVKKKRGGE